MHQNSPNGRTKPMRAFCVDETQLSFYEPYETIRKAFLQINNPQNTIICVYDVHIKNPFHVYVQTHAL